MSAPDFSDNYNDFLAEANIITQEDIELFLQLTQDAAWDIPSALGSVCQHDLPETNRGDFFMHRDDLRPENDWAPIDKHFMEVHGLDLTSDRINWNFDT